MSLLVACVLLQLHSAIAQNEDVRLLGLPPGSQLLASLKQRVVALASNSGVLPTIQQAAQNVLLNGWSLLLPTADERARALSALLPVAGQSPPGGATATEAQCMCILCQRHINVNVQCAYSTNNLCRVRVLFVECKCTLYRIRFCIIMENAILRIVWIPWNIE